jgi:hypothetical protein
LREGALLTATGVPRHTVVTSWYQVFHVFLLETIFKKKGTFTALNLLYVLLNY